MSGTAGHCQSPLAQSVLRDLEGFSEDRMSGSAARGKLRTLAHRIRRSPRENNLEAKGKPSVCPCVVQGAGSTVPLLGALLGGTGRLPEGSLFCGDLKSALEIHLGH